MTKWDPGTTETAKKVIAPFVKLWFRAEVRGLESFPPAGGAMVVCNHSGGVLTPDVIVLAPAFYRSWDLIARCTPRPLRRVPHTARGVAAPRGCDTRQQGERCEGVALGRSPAGVSRRGLRLVSPHFAQNVVDFNGRKGYVRSAIEAGVPIVPAVSIGLRKPSSSSPAVPG